MIQTLFNQSNICEYIEQLIVEKGFLRVNQGA